MREILRENRWFLLVGAGLLAIVLAVKFGSTGDRDEWLGFVYPDAGDLAYYEVIGAFDELDDCLRRVRAETSSAGSYECALNCRDEGVRVCERTVGNERSAPRAPVPAEHSEHAYVLSPDICSHGRVGAFGEHGVRGICSMEGRSATCIHAGENLLISYAYTPAAADLLERACAPGGTFTRLE